jgi:methylmalonyl-CoA mutase C-terminal domain/subunit
MSRVRCVLGMLGTDVHSKGIRTLARHFRDAGMEVVYLGEHNTPGGFAAAVSAEDADIVGLSFSTASYLHYVEELMTAMSSAGLLDVPVMVGGLIHTDDEPFLRELGVAGIFGPGSTTEAILEFVSNAVRTTSKQPTEFGRTRVH